MSAPLAASGSEPDLGAVSTKTVDAEGNATVVTVASGSVASAPAPVPEPEPLPANMKAQLDKARKAEEKYEKSPWSTNKLSEALKCYETVLEFYDATPAWADHLDVAKLLVAMGDCSRKKNAQGVEKALAMYERGYAILEKRLGPESIELVEPMEKMAGVLVKAFSGEFANAEKLLRRCVQLIEQHRGPDDASMAAACVDLGAVLRKIGSCDEAVAVEERAVAVLLKTAPDKPDAGVLQGAVALAVWKLGDLPKATTTMEAACAELAKFPDMSEKPPTNHYIVMLQKMKAGEDRPITPE
ncbi:hypothetical protein AURANDRAFT_65594 [Aureococcus anophagefferens]|uniref:Uncharacterized protein n=1 Tax=Aureococcus anophagefferens TaxID=44056 RepID=F0YEG8_AURAN|nr:hypothetical protein AURANDRAFT_65594 [Aureococcus anophagefferens]EGB06555.1 hypothetical protein AURANDRAFT_65594 [Aureococcus anophagefferens]|eukprot:XP_009038730.1 hypothetical protein AURANDRAFT_65594 [Aureococcus anophagefferens]